MSKEAILQEISESKIPVFVDFYADWCGPCRFMDPIMIELEEEYKDKIHFINVNIDEDRDYAVEFGVRSVPTMRIIKNGEIIQEFIGATSKLDLVAAFEKSI